MTAIDIINYFSSNLYFVYNDNFIYLIDNYRLRDEDYNYGICAKLTKNDLLTGNFNIEYIPDIYIDGFFDFLLNEDLQNTYGISKDIIIQLKDVTFSEWDIIFKKNKIDFNILPSHIEDICKIMRNEEPISSMSDKEINEYVHIPSIYEKDQITMYENLNEHFEYDI